MKFALFIAPGYEEAEAVITVDILRRANLTVDIVSITSELQVKSAHDVVINADKLIFDVNYDQYDGFILPGGTIGVENLYKNELLKNWLLRAHNDKKIIAAICAAPQILGLIGLLDDKEATSYPGCKDGMENSKYNDDVAAVIDDNIITGASVGSAFSFALLIVDKVLGEKKAFALRDKLVMRD